MTEELGVIEAVDVGCRDCGRPVLWMDVKVLRGNTLQVLNWGEAGRLINDAQVHRVSDLKGRPVVMECDPKTDRITFLRMA